MAIVNEDPAMVKFLLDNGSDVSQRSIGNFFTADDQKSGRKDSLEHEWFDLPLESNYEGYVILCLPVLEKFIDYPNRIIKIKPTDTQLRVTI